MKFKKALRVVWDNDRGHRYIPRANDPGRSFSWQVWDRKEQRFLKNPEIPGIDPHEPFEGDDLPKPMMLS